MKHTLKLLKCILFASLLIIPCSGHGPVGRFKGNSVALGSFQTVLFQSYGDIIRLDMTCRECGVRRSQSIDLKVVDARIFRTGDKFGRWYELSFANCESLLVVIGSTRTFQMRFRKAVLHDECHTAKMEITFHSVKYLKYQPPSYMISRPFIDECINSSHSFPKAEEKRISSTNTRSQSDLRSQSIPPFTRHVDLHSSFKEPNSMGRTVFPSFHRILHLLPKQAQEPSTTIHHLNGHISRVLYDRNPEILQENPSRIPFTKHPGSFSRDTDGHHDIAISGSKITLDRESKQKNLQKLSGFLQKDPYTSHGQRHGHQRALVIPVRINVIPGGRQDNRFSASKSTVGPAILAIQTVPSKLGQVTKTQAFPETMPTGVLHEKVSLPNNFSLNLHLPGKHTPNTDSIDNGQYPNHTQAIKGTVSMNPVHITEQPYHQPQDIINTPFPISDTPKQQWKSNFSSDSKKDLTSVLPVILPEADLDYKDGPISLQNEDHLENLKPQGTGPTEVKVDSVFLVCLICGICTLVLITQGVCLYIWYKQMSRKMSSSPKRTEATSSEDSTRRQGTSDVTCYSPSAPGLHELQGSHGEPPPPYDDVGHSTLYDSCRMCNG